MIEMRRRVAAIGLGALMLMGTAVYLRLWTIDYRITSSEADLLRRQFDLASREAMDESADWRKRFDEEADRVNTCTNELAKIKALNDNESKKKLEMLQKENMDLIERIETLKLELEAEKLKCSMRQS